MMVRIREGPSAADRRETRVTDLRQDHRTPLSWRAPENGSCASISGLPSGANTIAGVMPDNALAAAPPAEASPPGRISAETGRRRTFAVISHPDAGKSTLT